MLRPRSQLHLCLAVERLLGRADLARCLLDLALECARTLIDSEVISDPVSYGSRTMLNQLGKLIGSLTLARDRPLRYS